MEDHEKFNFVSDACHSANAFLESSINQQMKSWEHIQESFLYR